MTLRVLLVDDNLNFLATVRSCLGNMRGVEVVGEANDGIAALARATELQPDLLLLDVMMPNMNGLEVAKQIRQWPAPPRIVFLSMNDIEAYREVARGMGVLDFVGKADFVAEIIPIIERMVIATEKL